MYLCTVWGRRKHHDSISAPIYWAWCDRHGSTCLGNAHDWMTIQSSRVNWPHTNLLYIAAVREWMRVRAVSLCGQHESLVDGSCRYEWHTAFPSLFPLPSASCEWWVPIQLVTHIYSRGMLCSGTGVIRSIQPVQVSSQQTGSCRSSTKTSKIHNLQHNYACGQMYNV